MKKWKNNKQNRERAAIAIPWLDEQDAITQDCTRSALGDAIANLMHAGCREGLTVGEVLRAYETAKMHFDEEIA
jgi:hypothetical protein